MAHENILIPGHHQPGGYSHAFRAGSTLYVAGQVALDKDRNLVGKGDFAAQARQVYRNLKTVLEAAGGGLHNVVKMTSFLTHPGFIEDYRAARDQFMQAPLPPNTLLIVQSLATPDFLIEVEAIAVLD